MNVASLVTLVHPGDFFSYGAAKAGMTHMSMHVARDVRSFGIRVNVVSPGELSLGLHFLEGSSVAIGGMLIRCVPISGHEYAYAAAIPWT